MKNDYQLLDLAGLARKYQAYYKDEYEEAHRLESSVAKRVYDAKLSNLVSRLSSSELGSDGVEEAAREELGLPKPVQIDTASLKHKVRESTVSDWLAANQISQKLNWFGQQFMAYFGTWTPVKIDGKYCPEATYTFNVVERQDLFGLGSVLLAKSMRSSFFKDAPKGNQQYKSCINSLVPVVLAGFKRYQGIPYMQWDLSKIEFFENSEIQGLVGCRDPKLQQADVLALRNAALTPKTGARAGIPANPATCANLYHLTGTALGHLPKLAKYIILQTWAAHPQNRDMYAILDLEDWDSVPEPLTGTDLFVQPQRSLSTNSSIETPWFL